MSIAVFAVDEQDNRPVDLDRWIALARAVLSDEQVSDDAELTIHFVGEEAIAALNERYLGHEGPTDVLSFPIEDDADTVSSSPDAARVGGVEDDQDDEAMPILLGDVVLCPEVAWRNAPEHAGTYEDELALLLVHGILHLLGLDHEDTEEAEVMEAREQRLLAAHNGPPG